MESRYLMFSLGSNLYALPAGAVLEVIRLHTIARVPQGPAALLGVANLRGGVIAVIGLRELLGQDPGPVTTEKCALVLDQATPIALVVDAVASLESIAAVRIDTAQEAWQGQDEEKIVGVFKFGQQVAKILDIAGLLKAAFAEMTSGKGAERPAALGGRRITHERETVVFEMLLSFDVGGQEFALPLPAVDKILPLPSTVSSVSRPDAVIMGYISVSECLVPLLSLRGLLGFDSRPVTGNEKVLILKVAGAPVGLVADGARSIVAADPDAMEAMPSVLVARSGGEAKIRAIYRAEGGRRLISILSPELLFREDVMQRLAKLQSDPRKQGVADTQDALAEAIFLVFRLGDDEFGLPIESVVEVAQVPAQITRIPRTPKFLDGVVNLRGDVLPVVDQRRRFDMPKLENPEGQRLIVVKTARHRAGILVDSVSDVLRISTDAISPPPDLTTQISRLVRGVLNLDKSKRIVLLLDPTELITRAEQDLLDAFQAHGKKVRV